MTDADWVMDLRTPAEREALRQRIEKLTDLPLNLLAVLLLILLLIDFTNRLVSPWSEVFGYAYVVIWLIFLVEFLIELALAAPKLRFLRTHWLVAITVVVPFFRVLQVFRVLRAVGLVTFFIGFKRGSDILRSIFQGTGFVYVALISIGVLLLSAAALYYVEIDQLQSSIKSYGDALWWLSAGVTQINAQGEPTSAEGRLIGFAVGAYGLGVFGYVTGAIASFLLGTRRQIKEEERETRAILREIKQLREELQVLANEVHLSRGAQSPAPASSPKHQRRSRPGRGIGRDHK
jgi:voltage-gated potassium channel